MLDIKYIKENPDEVIARLAKKGKDAKEEIAQILALDTERRALIAETEAYVQRINNLRDEPTEERVHPQIKAHMKELERRAMSTLGRKVRISRSTHKKVLELSYSDDEDLEALLTSLCGANIFSETND